MAVYTDVTDDALAAFLTGYDIGTVVAFRGITEGVENSNFSLRTTAGDFILTLYEKRVDPDELPWFFGLMEHLARRGLVCPQPVHGRDGEALRRLCGRHAAITTFLPGVWPRRVRVAHCGPVGSALASLHRAGADYAPRRINALGPSGWMPLLERISGRADEVRAGLAMELDEALRMILAAWPPGLPHGGRSFRDLPTEGVPLEELPHGGPPTEGFPPKPPHTGELAPGQPPGTGLPTGHIHADMMPDNVFFLNNQVSGLIDFYFAATDLLAYDVAVCLNAWCFESDFSFNVTKGRALLSAYHAVRPLSAAEQAALPVLCQGAAIRFLLTRLFDWLNLPPGALVTRKDPLEYLRRLRFHLSATDGNAYGLQ